MRASRNLSQRDSPQSVCLPVVGLCSGICGRFRSAGVPPAVARASCPRGWRERDAPATADKMPELLSSRTTAFHQPFVVARVIHIEENAGVGDFHKLRGAAVFADDGIGGLIGVECQQLWK